ncbi:MAG: hypothetical protein ABIR27_09890 [Dokdonella sp.]
MRAWMLAVVLVFSAWVDSSQAATTLAIVVHDKTALRAEARDSAIQHAVLWAGDTLEVRGERLDYLQVYDHRRERAGFVRTSEVRQLSLQPEHAAELSAIMGFLRDSVGDESLGIAYAAAFLQAAPAKMIGADAFDALGTLADRLARRASSNRSAAQEIVLAAHLEVVASYGVHIRSFEQGGRMQLCYDGEAFRRVLALPASDEQKARAALALTRPECVDPDLTPVQRHELDNWRTEVLDRAPRDHLSDLLENRLRVRSAAVWASVAFQRTRRGEDGSEAAERALQELTSVDPRQLAESDTEDYTEASIRVGASRWAAQPMTPSKSDLAIATEAGEPGQTCIALTDKKHPPKSPLIKRCTFATVWPNSVRIDAQGSALTLAVQPMEGWRELWLFHRVGDHWQIDIAPPGTDSPEVGYIEFAGWVPGGKKLLAARESRVGGRFQQSFEVLDLATLNVDKRADKPEYLSLFYRWQDPIWKAQTLSLRDTDSKH